MRENLAVICMLFLTACASNTGILEIGDGERFIAKQAATGFPGTGGIKSEALEEASEYCSTQGKSLNIVTLHENEGPYVFGKYPRVELTFKCE